MSKYLFVVDLDGTLLTHDKKISDYTKDIFNKARELGHKIVIATGRPPRTASIFYDELNLDTPLICCNGAFVYNPKDENFKTYSRIISKEDVKTIYRHLKDKDIVESALGENLYETYIFNRPYFEFSLEIKEPDVIIEGDIDQNIKNDIFGLAMRFDGSKEKHEYIKHYLKTNFPNIKLTFWGEDKHYIDISNPLNSKRHAIEYIYEQLNIKKENVVPFGDSTNDLEMVTFFNGFKMLNCHGELVEANLRQTKKDNSNDGVAFEIANLLGL